MIDLVRIKAAQSRTTAPIGTVWYELCNDLGA